jgi:hypothetical protein
LSYKYLLFVASLSTTAASSSSPLPLFDYASSPNIGGKKERHMPLSSSSRFFKMSNAGIETNISVSLSSTYSENFLYFSLVASITDVKCTNYLHFFGVRKYAFPFSQLDSKSTKPLTKS